MHHDFGSDSAAVMLEELPSHSNGVQEYIGTSINSDSSRTVWSVNLAVCPFEGPYRGGHFLFTVNILESYPFVGPDVWVGSSSRPMWHPNIDMETGRVMLPLEWSPVLTLISLVLAIQMMLLEPSADHPLNLEACSYYTKSSAIFEQQVQRTLNGCQIRDTYFVPMRQIVCKNCMNRSASFGRTNRNTAAGATDPNLSHLMEEFDMILDTGSNNEVDTDFKHDSNEGKQRLGGKSPKKRSSSTALLNPDELEREAGAAADNGNPFVFTAKRGLDNAGYHPASIAESARSGEGSASKRNRVEWSPRENGHQPPGAFGQPLSPNLFQFGSMGDKVGQSPRHPTLNANPNP